MRVRVYGLFEHFYLRSFTSTTNARKDAAVNATKSPASSEMSGNQKACRRDEVSHGRQ